MRYVKWTLLALVLAAYAGVLSYSLPSRDVVRVLGTEVVRIETTRTNSAGERVPATRDQMRINTITPGGHERVYRNEDTGWGFPWYFKFDSADVSARAENLASTEENPKWVIVTHYGWRLPLFSWFPNALDLERTPTANPDLTPWTNIIIVTLLTLGLIAVWRILQAMFRRHVDPVLDDIGERRSAVSRWWRGKG